MSSLFDDDTSIDAIMRRWPATIRVILRNNLSCVGCPIGDFHTLLDVARINDLDAADLRRQLEAAFMASDTTDDPSPARRGPQQA